MANKITVSAVNKKVDLLATNLANFAKSLSESIQLGIVNKPIPNEINGAKSIWKKYLFKNGKEYEIAVANSSGTLVFRNSIFQAPFDDKEDYRDCFNDYEKCTLKPLLEKWWEENAPDELKAKYRITIPEIYNILPDSELPIDLQGKNQLWDIYKDWRNRIFGHHAANRSDWVWTRTAFRSYGYLVYYVNTTGAYNNFNAISSYGVAPACVVIDNRAR